MHKLSPSRALLLGAIVLTICSFAFGQETTGSIEGSIKDSAGALVPNLEVTVPVKVVAIAVFATFNAIMSRLTVLPAILVLLTPVMAPAAVEVS